MDNMENILRDVQERLGQEVPELYADKDWGQLSYEQPAVKFPCALIDLKDIIFTQTGGGAQLADTRIIITIANLRLVSSSQNAPKKEDAYQIIGLLAKVHAALHLFSAGDYAPLFRTGLRKVIADSSRECYELTYQTGYMVDFDAGGTTAKVTGVKLELH